MCGLVTESFLGKVSTSPEGMGNFNGKVTFTLRKVLFPFNFVPSAFFLRLLSNLTLNAPYKMESLSFLYNDSVLKFVEDVSS